MIIQHNCKSTFLPNVYSVILHLLPFIVFFLHILYQVFIKRVSEHSCVHIESTTHARVCRNCLEQLLAVKCLPRPNSMRQQARSVQVWDTEAGQLGIPDQLEYLRVEVRLT